MAALRKVGRGSGVDDVAAEGEPLADLHVESRIGEDVIGRWLHTAAIAAAGLTLSPPLIALQDLPMGDERLIEREFAIQEQLPCPRVPALGLLG